MCRAQNKFYGLTFVTISVVVFPPIVRGIFKTFVFWLPVWIELNAAYPHTPKSFLLSKVNSTYPTGIGGLIGSPGSKTQPESGMNGNR